MKIPNCIFVTGCNAAGKSSFIRTRINKLQGFEILMTDVYKARTKEIFNKAVADKKDIILETVFNDASFKDLADNAHNNGYYCSLINLFLDSPQHSVERVANRILEQNGLQISGSNIKLNFNESFKNVAQYFFYFDKSEFIYTGNADQNSLIMSFRKGELQTFFANDLDYPQKFVDYSHRNQRLGEKAYLAIKANEDYQAENGRDLPDAGFSY